MAIDPFDAFPADAAGGDPVDAAFAPASGRMPEAGVGGRAAPARGEPLFINGQEALAFEAGIGGEIRMLRRAAAMLGGGLFNVRLVDVSLDGHRWSRSPRTTTRRPCR